MPRTTSRVNKSVQIKAAAAKKRAEVEEAGLRGPRLGSISAATPRAQARRDARVDGAVITPASLSSAKERAAKQSAATATVTPDAGTSRAGRTLPLIEVRTAHSVQGSARLDAFAERIVSSALSRFLPRLTRIDVHPSDANAGKKGDDDKHCQIEVRPASRQPLSTTAAAGTIQQALTAAANRMKRLLAKRLDRRVRA